MPWAIVSPDPACPPAWAILASTTTTVDAGVDFRCLIRTEGYHPICDDRPVAMREIQPEGQP